MVALTKENVITGQTAHERFFFVTYKVGGGSSQWRHDTHTYTHFVTQA